MKYSIEKIYPYSVFRFTFFLVLIIGGLLAFIFLIVSLFLHQLLIALLIFIVGIPLLALIKGLIASGLALLYSTFAKKFGGMSIELEEATNQHEEKNHRITETEKHGKI